MHQRNVMYQRVQIIEVHDVLLIHPTNPIPRQVICEASLLTRDVIPTTDFLLRWLTHKYVREDR